MTLDRPFSAIIQPIKVKMKPLRHILSFVFGLLSFVYCPLQGQETVVVGTIFNEATGEPIVAAHVYYPSLLRTKADSLSTAGTTSDEQGSFVLKTDLTKRTTLVISAVGYRTQRYAIEPHSMAGVEVAMKEQIDWLEAVDVLPNNEPAKALIEAVKNHRVDHDRFLSQSVTEAQEVTSVAVSELSSAHLKKRLWKGLKAGMTQREDSTWLLPIYRQSQAVQLQGEQRTPISEAETQAFILTQADYSSLLHQVGNINFYQNTVPLLSQAFVSPLSASSTRYYRYFLADSLVVDDEKHYIVHFKAKNQFDPAFNGELEIDSATYALRRVSAQMTPQAGVNYLTGLHIEQTLSETGALEQETIEALLSVSTLRKDSAAVFPSLLVRHDLMPTNPSALSAARSTQPIEAPAALDTIPIVRVASWIATIATTGYIPMGTVVDIGHIEEILQVNEHEKVHIGLPFRTNEKLMKNICLEAAVGYGIKDRVWKGLGRASFKLPTLRRNILMFEYQDHYVWTEVTEMSKALRENSVGYKNMDFTAYAFEALHSNPNTHNTAARQQQGQIRWSSDWSSILETETYFKIGRQYAPLDSRLSSFDFERSGLSTFSFTTLGTIFRLGWQERRIDQWFRRIHRPTKYPTLWLGFEVGSWSSQQSTLNYQLFARIDAQLHQTVSLGLGGELDYAFQIGYQFGHVPFALLHHFEGNQGYAFDPYRFTLMNNFRYAADLYMGLHVTWNGRGILFNHIPGLRYLHLRELVIFKLAWGENTKSPTTFDFEQSGLSTFDFEQSALSTLHVPYVEIGCGIGNILRVGELYSVWRLTHRNDPATPLWALRFRLHLSL